MTLPRTPAVAYVDVETAEELRRETLERLPSCELVRLVSSGTEATMSAIRVARGFTARDVVVKFAGNYHGHGDLLLAEGGSGLAALGKPGFASSTRRLGRRATTSS